MKSRIAVVGGFALCLMAYLAISIQSSEAGPLTPPGEPAPSSRTLNEVYSEVKGLVPDVTEVTVPSLSDATGSFSYHLSVVGQSQGPIEGSVLAPGREGTSGIWSLSHEVVSVRDAASGLPTGKRQHKPFTIIKPVDKATPLLFNSLVLNETLTSCDIRCYAENEQRQVVNYFTITLTNARVSSISRSSSNAPNSETVSFTYQKITWTWEDGGITAEDDWETPVAK